MAAPKKSLETNPELAFVDVDLLDLYRRLRPLEGWSRTQKATTMDFIAAVQAGQPLPQAPQQSRARKMLRALLEFEAAPPPKRRQGTVAASAHRSRAMPGLHNSAGRTGKIVAQLIELRAA